MNILKPNVEFIQDEGYIKISGRSVEANIEEFWNPLCDQVEEYLNDPRDFTVIFDLEYFNTRSAKLILKFMNILKDKQTKANRRLIVKWMYDDNDIKEAGEDYSSIISFGVWKLIDKTKRDTN